MQTNFILDNFRIAETRSRHEDTVWVSLSITVGSNDPITAVTKIGNRNNGTFPIRRHVSADIPEDADIPVAFNLLIVNNGHGDNKFENGLQTAVSTLGTEGIKAATTEVGGAVGASLGASLGTAIVPLIGTGIGALGGWVVVRSAILCSLTVTAQSQPA